MGFFEVAAKNNNIQLVEHQFLDTKYFVNLKIKRKYHKYKIHKILA